MACAGLQGKGDQGHHQEETPVSVQLLEFQRNYLSHPEAASVFAAQRGATSAETLVAPLAAFATWPADA